MSGRQRNFDGRTIRLSGDDIALNDALDDLGCVPCCEVLGRKDLTSGTGMLTIQAKAAVSPRIVEIARTHGLAVEG